MKIDRIDAPVDFKRALVRVSCWLGRCSPVHGVSKPLPLDDWRKTSQLVILGISPFKQKQAGRQAPEQLEGTSFMLGKSAPRRPRRHVPSSPFEKGSCRHDWGKANEKVGGNSGPVGVQERRRPGADGPILRRQGKDARGN